ncbi:MAG: nitrous oxide reductase family maturation protein NosD [Rhodobacter sp.]|nr:nitrous oxide reductase family maturation protein NosD [Rhodobacter sp.]
MVWRALILLIACLAVAAHAETRVVPTEPGALAEAIRTAEAGDVLRLAYGIHSGSIVIETALTLDGGGAATLDGGGEGSVITVNAAGVTIKGLTIIGSGSGGEGLDAGVTLTKQAKNAVVRGNRILGNLVGVDIHGAKNALVEGNLIEGRRDHRMNDRGNGVYVWNAPGARVVGNDIRWGRDGIFVNASKRNDFIGNRFRDLRFAVHYMYAHHSTVADNISIGNHLGYAVMYSQKVTVTGNLSRGDRDHGIMLNYTNRSTIAGNRVEDGGEKCVFIYNAHRNRIEGNRLERCQFGIHFTAGSERNEITGNAFLGNRTQVKYAGTRWVDWSAEGRGNHWSDFAAYDLNGDGIAEGTYRPNDSVDRILWTQPAARLLLGSPAVQLVRWSQSEFPALLPGGVVDSHPLMHAVDPARPEWEETDVN